MIVDHISKLSQYTGLGKNFETVVSYINCTDLSKLETGKHIIDEDRVFVMVSDKQLIQVPQTWEVHKKYADIQLILEGSETIGYYPANRLDHELVFPADKDSVPLDGLDGSMVELQEGEFFLAMPQDIHLPNCPGKLGPHSRKAIFKVLLDA